MFNYKTLSILLLFVDFSWLGLVGLEHDSYKICLSIASVILAVFIARLIMASRFSMIVLSAVLVIVFSQLSMIAREAIKNAEFRQNFSEINTTEELSKDFAHGAARIWKICNKESEGGAGEYRYISLMVAYPVAAVSLLKKKPQKRSKK